MIDDVLINKTETIKRCISRVDEVYDNDRSNLEDLTKQDSIILNIQRLCEASIDIAMHLIAKFELGIPQNSREAFTILSKEDFIEKELSEKLKAMVGFRNLAVHNYQKLNLEIVRSIIEKELEDIRRFAELVKNKAKERKD